MARGVSGKTHGLGPIIGAAMHEFASPRQLMTFDVAIVGGGFAGVTAARDLSAAGRSVVLSRGAGPSRGADVVSAVRRARARRRVQWDVVFPRPAIASRRGGRALRRARRSGRDPAVRTLAHGRYDPERPSRPGKGGSRPGARAASLSLASQEIDLTRDDVSVLRLAGRGSP